MTSLITSSKTLEFITKAKKVHSDRYDYSSVVYIRSNIHITIKCLKHGMFSQTPSNHLSGQNCPRCVRSKQSIDSFIDKAIKRHGDVYDYSKVIYIGAHDKVDIICPIHGPFKMTPAHHVFGGRCPSCSWESYITPSEEWVRQFKLVHGNKYSYTNIKSTGVTVSDFIDVICPVHGPFNVTVNNHKAGRGCKRCSDDSQRADQEHFLLRARAANGNKYDYSKAIYKGRQTKVEVICPRHGSFFVTPANHYKGSKCPTCAISDHKVDFSEFVNRCTYVWKRTGDFEYYPEFFKSICDPTIIRCVKHDKMFSQIARLHTSGHVACPLCRMDNNQGWLSKARYIEIVKGRLVTLYIIEILLEDPNRSIYKVGVTARTVKTRFNMLRDPWREVLTRVYADTGEAYDAELYIKQTHYHNVITDKLSVGGGSTTECFHTIDLDMIKSYLSDQARVHQNGGS